MAKQPEKLWEMFKDQPDPVEAMALDILQVYKVQKHPPFWPTEMSPECARILAKEIWAEVLEWRDEQEAKEACNEVVR